MALTKEEMQTLLDSVRTQANNVDVTTTLLRVEQEYCGALNELDTVSTERTKIVEERDKYAKLNNDMWLEKSQLPLDKLEQLGNGANKLTNNNEPPQKMSFDDLTWD